MKVIWFVLLLALGSQAMPAAADTGLTIITGKGYVDFVAADDWTVLSMDTKGPIASVVFRLPNPADSDTGESTNLIFKLYDLATRPGRRGFDAPVKRYGVAAPEAESVAGWTVWRQHGLQHAVGYTILDAKQKAVGDRAAFVRLAWPHLPNYPNSYDEEMEQTFRKFLESVKGHLGAYKRREGEVVHRPTQ